MLSRSSSFNVAETDLVAIVLGACVRQPEGHRIRSAGSGRIERAPRPSPTWPITVAYNRSLPYKMDPLPDDGMTAIQY